MSEIHLTGGIHALAVQVGEQLSRRGLLLATAESCTGGWAASAITAIAGSSGWFDRGFVTYSNLAKQEMLGVLPATLESHGAVSEATAREMALGAVGRSAAHMGVAISGIAGPGGGTDAKPVGTVCFAWSLKTHAIPVKAPPEGGQGIHDSPEGNRGEGPQPRIPVCRAITRYFPGDREAVRRESVITALEGIVNMLREF